MGTHVQVDSLYVATAQFMPHHMDSIAAFQGLKVLHMDRHTMAGAMDSAAFAVIGELTQLEELVLAPQLTGVDDEGFMLGLGPLQRLRRLELYGLERVRHLVVLHMPSWTKCAVPQEFLNQALSTVPAAGKTLGAPECCFSRKTAPCDGFP